MNRDSGELLKSVLQMSVILCLAALFSTIAHKAFVDISALAQQHSGGEFWTALARLVLRNLSGG